LHVVEVPKPEPLPHDLLIKIKAVSVNPVDFKKRTNFGQPSNEVLSTPLIVGWDASGVVEKIGSEVQLFKEHDEVYFAGSIVRQGANAEYAIVDERIVGRKPKSFTFEQAAGVPLTALTAWEGLKEQLGIKPFTDNTHKTILVVGAAGGVGSITVQLAKKIFNLKVIATASRPETVDFSKSQGADYVINHHGNILEQLKQIGFKGVDYIYDCVNLDSNFDNLAPALNDFGKILGITGAIKPINYGILFPKRGTLTFEHMFLRPRTGIEIEKQHHILNQVADLIDKGVITDRVLKEHKFKLGPDATDLRHAHTLQETNSTIGKISLTVDF